MNKLFLTLLASVTLFCSCQSTETNSDLHQNKEVVLEYHKKAWSEGNLESLEDILSEDFVCH